MFDFFWWIRKFDIIINCCTFITFLMYWISCGNIFCLKNNFSKRSNRARAYVMITYYIVRRRWRHSLSARPSNPHLDRCQPDRKDSVQFQRRLRRRRLATTNHRVVIFFSHFPFSSISFPLDRRIAISFGRSGRKRPLHAHWLHASRWAADKARV